MRKTASQKIKLGIFVIIATILLVTALYLIGSQQHIFSNNLTLNTVFSNVNGLQLGNNVRYSGINVGTVSKIDMIDNTSILIEMKIDKKTSGFINKDAIAIIGSDGLVGSMVVNIIPGQDEHFIKDGDTIQSNSKISAENMLSTLNVTNENAALLTADLLKITNKILEGKGTLGLLINDSSLSRNLQITMIQLKESSEGTAQAVKELNQILNAINLNESVAGVLLNDKKTGDQIRSSIQKLEESSNSINELSTNLNTLVIEIKEGEGATNYLIENKELVKNIDSSITNIKQGTEKFNENMEALKSNFFFRSYFKKKEKKAKKTRENEE